MEYNVIRIVIKKLNGDAYEIPFLNHSLFAAIKSAFYFADINKRDEIEWINISYEQYQN